jgi:hypothetical protein
MGENEPEVRRQLMPAINERMLKVMTELHLSGEFKTADLLAAYLLQQFSRGAISSAHDRIKFEQAASGAEPEGPGLSAAEIGALAEFFEIRRTFQWAGQKIDGDDVLQHCREELAHNTGERYAVTSSPKEENNSTD